MSKKLYRGRPPHEVTIVMSSDDGRFSDERPLAPRNDLRDHSPTGFSWGYAGSGPAQLALALVADAVDDETAIRHYQAFKNLVVAQFDIGRPWRLKREDILESIRRIELAELRFQCRNRARCMILRARWPIPAEAAEEMIAIIRLHTGAPAHIAEGAFNDELAWLTNYKSNPPSPLTADLDRVLEEDR